MSRGRHSQITFSFLGRPTPCRLEHLGVLLKEFAACFRIDNRAIPVEQGPGAEFGPGHRLVRQPAGQPLYSTIASSVSAYFLRATSLISSVAPTSTAVIAKFLSPIANWKEFSGPQSLKLNAKPSTIEVMAIPYISLLVRKPFVGRYPTCSLVLKVLAIVR